MGYESRLSKYNIDKNAHYLVKMHPLENFMGIVYFKSDSTKAEWVECIIVEEQYQVADGYKIELRAIDKRYGKESYYQEDFIALVKEGAIIKIT